MSHNKVETALTGKVSRRLRWFGVHISIYLFCMVLLVAINLTISPSEIWFIVPIVAWGAPLAIHVAFVMGFFDSLFDLK